ncbi:guanine nucleotide-binding protein subunit beta-like protein 1 [Ceratina calcarata]|uniref:Guanine nucleotide-binding protein subunit beta-like protein 1 n=1 Tax=Ceratina calcarata TaxID=156304 RepID=A0AAJ7NAM0_9HYME|nr:guanine nucleotide-binding protein subunit beta-like protein 1 [Ceratina calcarata]
MLSPDPKYIFRGNMSCVHCVLFSINPNAEHLYAGTIKGNVHIWNLNTNRELCQIPSGKESCLSLLCMNNDLFVQHKCGLIKAYKNTGSQWILNKSIDTNFYHYCRFQSLSEHEVLVPLEESTVGILSTNTFNIGLKLKCSGNEDLGEAMVIKPLRNERLVLVGYERGTVILWDIRQSRVLSSLKLESCPMALDFDNNVMKGVIGSPSDNIQTFSLSDNSLFVNNKIPLTNPGISVITIRPDAKIMAAGGWDSRVRIFSWKNLKPLAVLDQHRETVQDICFSLARTRTYDNKYLMATAAKDGYVALWDIYN